MGDLYAGVSMGRLWGMRFHPGDTTGTIQQFLAACQIAASPVDVVCENRKTLRPVRPRQANDHQGLIAHIPPCTRQFLSQEPERIVGAKMFSRYPHCRVLVSGKEASERGPVTPNLPLIGVQGLKNVCA